MTEADRDYKEIPEFAVTSLGRSKVFWALRDPMYSRQLGLLEQNYDSLLEEAEGKYAVVIGDLIPIHFEDLDLAFEFAKDNAAGQPAIIHEITREGIMLSEVYDRIVPIRRAGARRENIYKTRGALRSRVEHRDALTAEEPVNHPFPNIEYN